MAMVNAVMRARQDAGTGPAIKVAVHTSQILVGRGAGAPELDLEGKQAALIVLNTLIERGSADNVMISEATAPFLSRGFELHEIGVEGLPDGRAFALVGRGRTGPGQGGRASTFVGRRHELDLLSSRLESASRGRGQIVGISGEAGIGKSRLIFEFRESLVGKPVTYVEGQCTSHGSATPYLPVLDLFKTICGISDADAPAEMADKARSSLLEAGLDLLETAPYLLHLLDIEHDAERFAASPEVTKAHIFDTLRQLVLRKSRLTPLVIVVEDLHWIDRTSEEYLASLAEVVPGARLLLVCTHRDGHRPPWIEKSYAAQVALQPLAPEDSLRLVRSVIGANHAPDAAIHELIVTKSEGNPFFVEELARTVREQVGLVTPMAVPDTVEEVLGERIDRLAADDKRLLEVAAVVGKDVPFSVVRAVTGIPEETLRRAFERLKSAEFLYETSLGPETEYTFKHTLTHEVAYGRLLAEPRRALHERTVAAIERVYEDRLAEQVERLAYHAVHGEMWAKAVDYLRQAAARAAARSAHREAVAHLEQALAALGRLPEDRARNEQAIDIRLDLRQSLLPLGELERILSHLRDAEPLAEKLGDPRRLGRLSVYMTGQYYQMGNHHRALEYGKRTQAITETLRDFSLDVATNAYVGQIHLGRGDYRAATALFKKNVEAIVGELIRERFGLPQLPAVHSRYCLVLCLAELGEFAEGVVRGQEAIRIAESIEQPLNLTAAASGLGRLYHRKGDFERAIPILERALELTRTWNLRIWFPQVATALGLSYASMGRPADARPLLEQSVELAAAMRLSSAESPALTALGEARLLEGQLAESLDIVQHGLTVAQENGRRGHEAWALRLLGEIALRQSNVRLAQESFIGAMTLANELGMRPLTAHCHLGLSRASRLTRDLAKAEHHGAAAVGLFREMDMGLWLAQASAEVDKLP
jgi:tetratricopeptide (TPR) repeat protein